MSLLESYLLATAERFTDYYKNRTLEPTLQSYLNDIRELSNIYNEDKDQTKKINPADIFSAWFFNNMIYSMSASNTWFSMVGMKDLQTYIAKAGSRLMGKNSAEIAKIYLCTESAQSVLVFAQYLRYFLAYECCAIATAKEVASRYNGTFLHYSVPAPSTINKDYIEARDFPISLEFDFVTDGFSEIRLFFTPWSVWRLGAAVKAYTDPLSDNFSGVTFFAEIYPDCHNKSNIKNYPQIFTTWEEVIKLMDKTKEELGL